ncbi:hypothetical protein [Tritonibacter scottomollicae]|uniref:Uncharacterized protein n=1 Tax=Tritonibacter scottomollicae TaxID=483013 RepID=A0A2T1A2U0_TRISK|nr:hypothetical protein [Tritonibacter scottomollicae]PRZ42906.1 hypothetical protein CLV89_1315 [Tritonibacter scottomollicae]
MANRLATTPPRVTEPRTHFAHSPISRSFSELNGALAQYIEYERDIECVDSFDPAFANWLTDAEAARHNVLDRIASITTAPISRDADRPFQRISLLTRALITCETGADFTALYAVLGSHGHLFACFENDPVGHRVQQMLEVHQDHLHAMADLGEFAEEPLFVDPTDNAGDQRAMTATAAA